MNTAQIDGLTLAAIGAVDPSFNRYVRLKFTQNYDEFVEIIYQDLDMIIRELEADRHVNHNLGEDQLTTQLKTNLRSRGHDANHEAAHGGNTDLVVRHPQGFVWLGEAKIAEGSSYLYEGYLQLTTRYATGSNTGQQGGILIYIRTPNANRTMTRWKSHLCSQGLPEFFLEECKNNEIAFFSTQTLENGYGLPYRVKHIPLCLSHNPQDRSARNRKNG